MTPEEVLTEFPNGARVADPQAGVSYPLVHMHQIDDKTIAGWAYPNKDFYFDVSSAKQKGDGYLLKRQSAGNVCLLTPLSKNDGDKAKQLVDGV